eukprot:143980-Chlamydomonas_euryale.AAC.1
MPLHTPLQHPARVRQAQPRRQLQGSYVAEVHAEELVGAQAGRRREADVVRAAAEHVARRGVAQLGQ